MYNNYVERLKYWTSAEISTGHSHYRLPLVWTSFQAKLAQISASCMMWELVVLFCKLFNVRNTDRYTCYYHLYVFFLSNLTYISYSLSIPF